MAVDAGSARRGSDDILAGFGWSAAARPGGRPARRRPARGSLGARLPVARATVDHRGPPRRRGLLVARRPAARVPERTGAGKPLLPDLRARPCDRRHQAHLAGHGQDHLLVLPSGTATRFCSPPRTRIRDRSTLQEEELAFRASGKERRYAWDYDPEMDIYTYSEKTGALERLTTRTGLRRRSELLTRRPVDSLLVDARRLRPPAVRLPNRSSSRPIRATSPKSTSCGPTDQVRSGSRASPATTAGRSSAPTARASCGAASMSRGSSPTSGR